MRAEGSDRKRRATAVMAEKLRTLPRSLWHSLGLTKYRRPHSHGQWKHWQRKCSPFESGLWDQPRKQRGGALEPRTHNPTAALLYASMGAEVKCRDAVAKSLMVTTRV